MKYIIIISILFLKMSFLFSQENDTIYRTYDDIEDLNRQIEGDSIVSRGYIDTTFNYDVKIPKWLTLKETGSEEVLGGTLPAINGIENAIMITGFHKNEFKSFDEFKHTYLTGNKFGKTTLYSEYHLWYGQKNLKKIDNGVRQNVYIAFNKRVYYHEFILLETPTAYLWIQFTATPDTYDTNISKFDEFMNGFKIIYR